jgi:hypothetical protein
MGKLEVAAVMGTVAMLQPNCGNVTPSGTEFEFLPTAGCRCDDGGKLRVWEVASCTLLARLLDAEAHVLDVEPPSCTE